MSKPARRRPNFGPEYGISAEEEGMLDWSWAEERLAASRNYWIVTAGAGGEPAAAPVWGVWADAVYFGTTPARGRGETSHATPASSSTSRAARRS